MNFKKLIISILIPNIFGFLGSMLGGSTDGYKEMIKPSFAPPGVVFPIVWTILFILMGISSYIIYVSKHVNRDTALLYYFIQLVLNSMWTFFFFKMEWYLFSFIWIIIILVFVLLMFKEFYKINKTAAYLQIPYILWLIFAGILNYAIYILN